MATIHETVAVTGLDRAAVTPFIAGEQKVLEQYDRAIAEVDPPTADMLMRQKSVLPGKIEAMKALET